MEENTPLPASLESRPRTRIKQLAKKPSLSMQKMPMVTPSSASNNQSNVSISVEPTTNSREEEYKEAEENSLDMEDDLSLSLSSEDGWSEGEDEGLVKQVHKTKRGVKRAKGDVPLSPSKCKVKRVKRADCWKYFKVVEVQSKKKFGEKVTKAKCKFCYKLYVYQPGGPTSQLN